MTFCSVIITVDKHINYLKGYFLSKINKTHYFFLAYLESNVIYIKVQKIYIRDYNDYKVLTCMKVLHRQ